MSAETPTAPAERAPSGQHELSADALRWTCDPSRLPFETTDEVAPIADVIGQDRAVSALAFGLEVRGDTFNVFVAGASGTGRTSTTIDAVHRAAGSRPAPHDWCYIFNFDDSSRPATFDLPAGSGRQFEYHVRQMVEQIRRDLEQAFASREYRHWRDQTHRPAQEARERLMQEMGERARREGFLLSVTPAGPVLVPAALEGRPLTPDELSRLPDAERQTISKRGDRLSEAIRDGLAKIERLNREAQVRVAEHDRQVAETVAGPRVDEYVAKYHDSPRAATYLGDVRRDIVQHIDVIRRELAREEGGDQSAMRMLVAEVQDEGLGGFFDRYAVNVLVHNEGLSGAPVVVESHPTYYSLLGRIEYRSRLGSMVTDFRFIRPGALHRANGGYLVLNALDVLTAPLAWDALKRSLRTREILIENMGEQFTPIPAATVRPAPIPLDVKVILIGPPWLYYLLDFSDEEFRRLFRIRADFDTDIDRTDDHLAGYSAFVSRTVRECGLRPFHRSAVARVAEYGVRLAEHQHRLSTRFRQVADVVHEASYWAEKENSPRVVDRHVTRAVEQKRYRSNLIEEKLQRLVDEHTILLDVTGTRVGQVNGLSVLVIGEYAFGRPVRITATTGIGAEGLVNLERETKLSGRIHNKAFLTLTSFLIGRYAQEQPLALSARITFEQTYDEVEGDSASSSELYALLSSLSGLPIRQGIAVTGSVNQLGEVQAVGGLTAKVEGFFDTCQRHGLTGDQGVVVPRTAVQYLMLRDDVVQAVRDGRFHVWAVSSIDEGIEILTGTAAGQRSAEGMWDEGSVNARVEQRLREYAERLKSFARAIETAEVGDRAPADVRPEAPRLGAPPGLAHLLPHRWR